ncbi:DNA replication/repair protein RecF [Vagococcus coleopterorum]|uniref:DNA replication and repair protein RecF n=1 Tax=Vagococcus coleopterorum TaxID=2714946 RepID=A0A6G8AM14_9ENTE|nr:DNA replication/repair protein RecF [Vagococcus coleopterorum]QIL45992.1 DNA replication/repair protein RecF [Vagococcus coleopterorum]
MRLTKLSLLNFRNYKELSLKFDNSLVIFLGENAQGKTNLLESIYVLAMTRSHRTTTDKELIGWSDDFGRIEGDILKHNKQLTLEMVVSNKGKKTKVNHLEKKRLSEYVGELNVVLFAPEDLYLIKGAPQLRRRFIDMELGQINPHYLYHLTIYQKVLKQRNKYLKQLASDKKNSDQYLDVLTEQLANSGSYVLYLRYQYLIKLEKWSQEIHDGITNGREILEIKYETKLDINSSMERPEFEEYLLAELKKNYNKDIFKQSTSVGPHRDDLSFYIDKNNVQNFGSQGQQRTTALSLKLAEIELIKEETGEYPVLLLDDVMSELDDDRQIHLLKTIENKVQTFITTTTLKHLEDRMLSQPEIYQVRNGQVERKSDS